MLRPLLKALALLLGVGLFLAGVLALGRLAQERLREQNRCTAALAEVECSPPPGMTRGDFLDEVQYFASLPPTVNLLEEGVAVRLAEAFGKHPWVARVEQVAVTPPRHLAVKLLYRQPALAVPLAGRLRVVDGEGVLLPPNAPADGLPVYQGKAPPPAGPAGAPWGDAGVENAARASGHSPSPLKPAPGKVVHR